MNEAEQSRSEVLWGAGKEQNGLEAWWIFTAPCSGGFVGIASLFFLFQVMLKVGN